MVSTRFGWWCARRRCRGRVRKTGGVQTYPPIGIKLSGPVGGEGVIEQGIDSEEELPGTRTTASGVDAGAGSKAGREASDGDGEVGGSGAGDGEGEGELSDQLSGADEAPVGGAPTGDQEEPMLDE